MYNSRFKKQILTHKKNSINELKPIIKDGTRWPEKWYEMTWTEKWDEMSRY